MSNFNTSQTLGEIVVNMPKASEVFKNYRIDFCCGGHRTLGEALKEQNLNANEVLTKLDKAFEETRKYKRQTNFTSMRASELIDYIVNTHHVFTKSILPELSEYVTKILRVHGANHNELFNVHKLFHAAKADLEQHLIKEEEILFPLVVDYEKSPSKERLQNISRVMKETEDEHDAVGKILKEIRRITEDYRIPKDACSTFVKTYERLQELESDLFQHIHLENNILFKNLRLAPDGSRIQ